MVSEALDQAADLCREFEGLYLSPYICPAGYPTIGYGTVYKPDGSKVTMADPPIDEETAEAWLMHELTKVCLNGVLKSSPKLVANTGALAAAIDFTYNLGIGRYRASTLKRKIDNQDWDDAKTELSKWVWGGGRILPGLVRRRAAEARLF